MTRLRDDETGAEMVEFAVAGPVVLLLIFGIVYALLTTAAYLSLNHAASVGVRYAAIPHDPIHGVYPTDEQVAAKVAERTPFFSADDCSSAVIGDQADNAPVVLELDCGFPNPFGRILNALGSIGSGQDAPTEADGPHHEGDLVLSVHAKARRE